MKTRTYRHVVAAVCGTPWAILQGKLDQIQEMIALRAAGGRFTKTEIRQRIGAAARPRDRIAQANSGGGSRVAVLNLFGVVTQRVNAMSDISGGTSAEKFAKAYLSLVNDPQIGTIVIRCDSPGGTIPGVPELSDLIYRSRSKKRTIAVVDPECASAAYWICSACSEIVATEVSEIGSIGVLMMHSDQTKFDEDRGFKFTTLTTAPFKAEGNPHQPLPETARAAFQKRIEDFHVMFTAAIARNRSVSVERVSEEFGQGRTLLAQDALRVGMIDRIGTFESVLRELGVGVEDNVQGDAGGGIPPVDVPDFSMQGQQPQEQYVMDPKTKEMLIERGLCTQDTPDAEAAVVLRGYLAGIGHAPTAAAQTATVPPATASTATVPATLPAVPPVSTSAVATEDIVAMVRLTRLESDSQLELISELTKPGAQLSLSQINERIGSAVSQSNPPAGATTIRPVAAELDKFRVAARDSILIETWGRTKLPKQIFGLAEQDFVDWQPSQKGRARHLASPLRLAARCLVQAGIPQGRVDDLAPADIARLVMGKNPMDLGIFVSSDGPFMNVSGMYSNILYDASNVLLRRSYAEANTTFQAWMKEAQSLPDFKTVHKTIAGELPDPKAIPEDGEFEETTTTDSRESYRLTVWGEIFSITWQTIVDDKLNAFTEIPMKQGKAMRRKQNKLAYGILIDNSALSDGVALFETNSLASGGHNNLATGAGAPSVTTLNTLYTKMAQMTGLNVAANTVLNLEPKYIILPPVLRGTVLELLGSTANPAAGGSAAGSSGVKNIWENALTPVIDAQLGLAAGGSDTAWYLAADNGDVDTVEYAYLQGLETPALDQETAFDRLGVRYRIYQCFAVKALDFRGLQKHAGA